MTGKRFKMNWRLWFWISLVLFVVPWFIPNSNKSYDEPDAYLWYALFAYPDHSGEIWTLIGYSGLLYGLPAIFVGWVLQCAIVMVGDSRKSKSDGPENSPPAPK